MVFLSYDTSNKAAAVMKRERARQVALEELQALDQKKPWQQHQLKAVLWRIKFIAQIYFFRLHIHAMEMTSSEILRGTFSGWD